MSDQNLPTNPPPPPNPSDMFPPLPPPPGMPPHKSSVPPFMNLPPPTQPCLPEFIPVVPAPSSWPPPSCDEPFHGYPPPPPHGSWYPPPGVQRPPQHFYDSNRGQPRGGRRPYYRGPRGGHGHRGGRGSKYHYDGRGRGHTTKRKSDFDHHKSTSHYPSKRSNDSQYTAGGWSDPVSSADDKIFTKMFENPWAVLLTEEEERQHYERLAHRFLSAPSFDELMSSERKKGSLHSPKTTENVSETIPNEQDQAEEGSVMGQTVDDGVITSEQLQHEPPSCNKEQNISSTVEEQNITRHEDGEEGDKMIKPG